MSRSKPPSSLALALLLLLCSGVALQTCNAFVVPTRTRTRSISLSNQNQPNNHDGPPPLFNLQQRFEDLLGLEGKSSGVSTTTSSQDEITASGRSSLMMLSSALAPVAEVLDNTTDGWALSYADLRPESEETAIGQSFLATNIAYAAVGFFVTAQGEFLLGFLTELVSVASFFYHYTQLQQPYNRTDVSTVKLALTVDYILAVSSIVLGMVYVVMDQTLPPPEVLATSVFGIGCLLACWVWEKGYPYIVLHSLWHICSAATAYSIGVTHAMSS